MQFFTGINYLAVLVAAIVSMVIGSLWYSPVLFGNLWMHASGWTKEAMERERGKGMAGKYVGMFIGALIMSLVLAHFVQWTGVDTWLKGAVLGLVTTIGFIATAALGGPLFEGRKWSLYWINVFYYAVQLIIIGALFDKMAPVLWVIAVLSNWTVIQRMTYTYYEAKHLEDAQLRAVKEKVQ